MNRRKALAGAVLVIATAAMPVAGYAARLIVVEAAPPPERVEVVPGPRVGYAWAPGYWGWDRGRHVWVRGHWVRERRGYHWVPHRWQEREKRWHFETGHWDRD